MRETANGRAEHAADGAGAEALSADEARALATIAQRLDRRPAPANTSNRD